jgi:hypothetical protein
MNRGIVALLLVVVALAAGGGGLWYVVEKQPFDSAFLKACDEAIKDNLRSPSTYQRIEVSEVQEQLSIDDFTRGMEADEAALYKGRSDKAVRTRALISYDAANVYGTPIRDLADCTYDTIDGSISVVNKFFVKIDGKTLTEKLLDDIRRAKQQ